MRFFLFFVCIQSKVKAYEPYFIQKMDNSQGLIYLPFKI